jgi:hypothetical protein
VIPVRRLDALCVAVRDLEAAARAHSLVYGIERWRVASGIATGSSPHGVTFRLVRLVDGVELPGAEREGIYALRLAVDPDLSIQRGARSRLLDTTVVLGGWCVELVAGDEPPPTSAEEWTFPVAGAPPAPITRVWHLGVAVRDLDARITACRALLGATDWSVVELRPERATLDGRPVSNAFRVARAPLAGFELELIQPTVEPTHYRRELLDPFGEGVHHVLALPQLTDAELAATRTWMEARGAPVAMSGQVRGGAAEFFYFDTRALLGGYLLEAIVRRDME